MTSPKRKREASRGRWDGLDSGPVQTSVAAWLVKAFWILAPSSAFAPLPSPIYTSDL